MGSDEHPTPAGPRTVLVVEDEMLVQMLVADVVADLGLEALEAADGPSALAVLAEQPVALMVTDVGLPGMPGTQLAEAARALRPGLKVLFVTGYGENPALAGLGEDFGVISKPFVLDDLSRKIAGMLGMG